MTFPASTRRELLADDLLLVLAVGLVFGRTLAFGFVNWDDTSYVLGNPLVHHPLAQGWRAFFTTPVLGYPAPVTVLSHHLDLVLGHGAAWPFHLSNVLIHALNVLLWVRVVRSYGLSRFARLTAALLFACHPLVVEPVAWVNGTKDLLCAGFVLLGFLVYRRGLDHSPRVTVAAAVGLVLCGVFAFFSKPLGVVLPLLVAADLVAQRRRPSWPLGAALGLMAVLAALGSRLAFHVCAGPPTHYCATPDPHSTPQRLLAASQHLAMQLGHWLLPVNLLPKYPDPLPLPATSPLGLGGLVAVALGVVAAVWAWRSQAPRCLLALLWVAVTFAPPSGLIELKRGPADAYFYLPGLGLALGAGLLLDRARAHLRRRITIPVLLLVGGFAFAAFVQTGIWRTSVSLWEGVVEAYPDHPRSYWAYASALIDEGRLREAIAVYERGMARHPYPPDNPDVLVSLGRLSVAVGDFGGAVRYYGDAARHFPPDPARSLALLAVYTRHPVPAYAATARRARHEAHELLTNLSRLPPGPRRVEARRLFERHLRGDAIPAGALQLLARDPTTAAGAAELLALYGVAPPAAPGAPTSQGAGPD